MIGTIAESTRQLVAERIKTEGTLDAELGRATPTPMPVPRDRVWSR